MSGAASPLAARHVNHVSRRPSYMDDMDELAGDTIPCSPGAMLRHDPTTTQPTQVLDRPALVPSSPPSIVEVPASSPFQPPAKRATSFGTRLAPAGTTFRPPTTKKSSLKRPADEPVHVISDDENELAPPRGDIRPTKFQTQISSFMYNPSAADEEKKNRERLRRIFHVFGSKFPPDVVRKALRENNNDVEDAIDWLDRYGRDLKRSSSTKTQLPKPDPRQATATPPKEKKPKRRLVQGLRNPSTPSPQKPDPLVIDLVGDKEDLYEADQSPSPDPDAGSKLLDCLNDSTAKDLSAMTGMDEKRLQPMIDSRPFRSIGEARKVTVSKKVGNRKMTKVTVGESVVEAVEVYLDAVTAIDTIVSECEKKARMVGGAMDSWDVDSFGRKKKDAQRTPDLPPTPTSVVAAPGSDKLSSLPVPQQPSIMDGHCQMRPFQVFGLNWMSLLHSYDIGCILADEMGLGKTCQVISLISHLVESYDEDTATTRRPWPNLVVVPPSTYNNWLSEFDKFAPDLSVMGYRGKMAERMDMGYEVAANPEAYHVVLATYSQLTADTDIESMNSMGLHASIYDEGHKMKNPETKAYKDLRRIRTDWRMLLTGTPVQNDLLEMVSLLSFINPKMFDGYMTPIKYMFQTRVSVRDLANGAFLYGERVKRARTILGPFILQRRKDQVISDLPRKTRTHVLATMTDSQKAVYEEYQKTFLQEPSEREVRAAGRKNDQNNPFMQLRKAAIHPLLFRRHFTDEAVQEMGEILMRRVPQSELQQPDLHHLVQELKNSSDFDLHLWCRDHEKLLGRFDYPEGAELDSGKVRKLLELVDEYQRNGDRVLVFSKFNKVIDILREVLFTRGVEYRALVGQTDVAERQDIIDDFNGDASIPVFLLTTGAGGTGINLTSANKVVIFDQSDNPQDDIQAENRVHRLGQKRDVEIVRLLSEGTIEELVNVVCQRKMELADKVTGAAADDAAPSPPDEEKNIEHEVRRMMGESLPTPP